jgi:hypothetical protein
MTYLYIQNYFVLENGQISMWNFQERGKRVPRRDPTDKEYFADEDSGELLPALVRESIQNSLDASDGSGKVRVKFTVGSAALNSSQSSTFLSTLLPHINAADSGIRNPEKLDRGATTFLTIEDFGTTGLEGAAYSDEEPVEDVPNQYYYFWRHIGKGGKSGDDLGRWGLGKTVFPAISQVGAYFGLTVRESDSAKMLMGLSVLKHHHVEKLEYQPYGYFADVRSDGVAAPITSDTMIDEFAGMFDLSRTSEPGLSVVILIPDEQITTARLINEALAQFYFAITTEHLEVTISNEHSDLILDKSYVIENLNEIKTLNLGLANDIELAIWFATNPNIPRLMMSDFGDRGPSESSKNTLDELTDSYDAFEPIAVSVPVEVFPKGKNKRLSSVTLIGRKGFSSDRAYVSNIRRGLSVPGMRTICPTGSRFIAYISESVLSSFLGDAENVSHTNWTANGRVSERYDKVAPTIAQVKLALPRFYDLVLDAGEDSDGSLLTSFFPTPSNDSKIKKPVRKRKKDGTEIGPPTPPPTRPVRRFSISDLASGFRVSPGEPGSKTPNEIRVQVAYDTIGPKPFKSYEPFDFELDKAPISVSASGCKTQQKGKILVIFAITDDFEVRVEGFDTDRDLITDGMVIR